MKPFIALVWKDIRSLKWFLVFLFITVPAAAIFFETELLLVFGFGVVNTYHSIFYWLGFYSYSIEFIFPVLLIYTLNVDVYSQTKHTSFSLPVRRFTIMLSKVVIIAASAFILRFLSMIVGDILWWKTLIMWIETHFGAPYLLHHYPYNESWIFSKWLWMDCLKQARHLLLFPGMVCFAQGVTAIVKRRRFAVWTMTFFITLFIYSLISNGYINDKFITIPLQNRPFPVYLLDLEAGLVFLAAGLFLFDRFAEV
jgi:hypothetical protein